MLLSSLLPLLACAAIQDDGFEVPDGFVLERALTERRSYLALTVAGAGRLVLSTEEEGLVLAEDPGGDGWFEERTPLAAGFEQVQGLCWSPPDLFVVGRRGKQLGLWRGILGEDSLAQVTLVLPFEGQLEHGPHAVVEDGDGRLLVTIGDAARASTPPATPLPPEPHHQGPPTLADPGGFGRSSRWPYGHVLSVDPDSGEWELVVAGLRNAYDLVQHEGEWFTVDSDMEWDVGLPWYREARALHLVPGLDYGSRPGSAVQPGPPSLVRLGRASPTGMAVVRHGSWPAGWRDRVLVGDWINARVDAINLNLDGGVWHSGVQPFIKANGAWNVTDLAFDEEGTLFLVSGGRGTPGDVLRVTWDDGPSAGRDVPCGAPAPFAWPDHDDKDVAALVSLLADTDDPVERLRLGNELRARDAGWDAASARAALDLFEEAAGYSGGGNLQGYVGAMLAGLIANLPATLLDTLVDEGALGPRALAVLVGQAADPGRLIDPLRVAFEALDEEDDLALAQERKRALLLALRGTDAPGLVEWLRAVHDDEAHLAASVLPLLAERAEEADFARLVAGLSQGHWEVRQGCAQALVQLDTRPDDAATQRAVLDQARKRGARSGTWMIDVLAHWSGHEVVAPDWATTLSGWEVWFRHEFPDFVPTQRGPAAGPHWDLEALAIFLERSAGRGGSPARGAEVFRSATCDRCHTLGKIGSGWAPDLTGVTQRFETRALLDALINPSAVIADRYATTVVRTDDGDQIDGRVVRESADALLLLLASGAHANVPLASVTSRTPSPISAMPEDLLANLTLEELKDLVAYLAVDGRIAAGAPPVRPALDLFADAQRSRWHGNFTGWALADGVLRGELQPQPGNSAMLFRDPPADFELEFDVLCTPGGSSGVLYRARVVEDQPDPVGYRVAVGAGARAALQATDGRGTLGAPAADALARALDPRGWNHVFLRVQGGQHTLEWNGMPVLELLDGAHAAGVLGFQLHGGRKADVYYANPRLR